MKRRGRGNPPSEGTEAGVRADEDSTGRDLAKTLILAAVIVSALAFMRISPLGRYLNPREIGALQVRLLAFGHWAPVIFLAGGGAVIALGAPRSIVSLLGGMVFGPLWGTCLALGAALLGSVPVFLLTRWLGRPLFHKKVGPYLEIVRAGDTVNGLFLVFLLRQLPLACIVVNVLIGLTSVSVTVFLAGSTAGLLPEAFIFALFGGSLRHAFLWRVTTASVCLVALVLIMRAVYRRSELARGIRRRAQTQ
ncbi:MAG: TVP38/TMEM64 family protein [Deltaproteobacteria bacterium]|nr:TVP38/TMEM64 family protein [Deltaproteobacteria bacterium]MBW1923416.1 TVP38/TMEM64 family protein [Deltaproteobacteria bacterium]MBW1948828.1 TVP38/TMEM64 family protein [Deltaproteobacteria bacterium]MBW2008275.1 TVP38/TMEM64 family protein [Deltaproteobacteria bacterium]MBW2102078.1 TVP38/TMEM64 family protein [Deltaproteobacteria bacterium]